MFAIMMSFGYSILAFVLRSVLVKFFVMFSLFFVATSFIAYLGPKLPGAAAITQAFAAIPAGVWWVLDLFKVPLGLQLVLTGYVTRFCIRRIPLIG